MDDATELADALRQLIQVIGWWRFVTLLTLGLAAIVCVVLYRGKQTEAAIQAVIDAKDETIERIAAQNREYRVQFLVHGGMNLHEAYFVVFGRKFGGAEKRPGATTKDQASERKA